MGSASSEQRTNTSRPHLLCLLPPSLRRQFLTDDQWKEINESFDVTANESDRNWNEQQLLEAVPGADAVLTAWGSPPFTEAVLEKADRLRLIVHMAGSVKFLFPGDVVDRFVKRKGVAVVSCAGAIAINVAEATIGLMIFGLRQWLDHILAFRERGVWRDPSLPSVPKTLSGGTVGIIGAGSVGREVIRLLHAFRDVAVFLYDPYCSEEVAGALGARKVSLQFLLGTCDIVSLHAPALPETERMIGEKELDLLKDGALFLNTSRGRLVDTEALVRVLQSRPIFAILDVTDPEPLPTDHPLRFLPNCVVLPHVTGAGIYGYRKIGVMTVRALNDFFFKGTTPEGAIDWDRYQLLA